MCLILSVADAEDYRLLCEKLLYKYRPSFEKSNTDLDVDKGLQIHNRTAGT